MNELFAVQRIRREPANLPNYLTLVMLPRRMLLVAICAVICQAGTTRSQQKDKDIVIDLELTPEVAMISASWQLLNPSGEVQRYDVRWLDETGDSRLCTVDHFEHDDDLSSTRTCNLQPPLKPCTEYQVVVLPKRIDNKLIGHFDSKAAFTLEEVSPEPQQVNCNVHPDNRALTVTWSAPNTPCDITGYEIIWNIRHILSLNIDDNRKTHISPALSYTITKVTPYTMYDVCVAGIVVDKPAGHPSCCTAATLEATPSAPLNLVLQEATSSSLTLEWQPPEQPNGIITGYTITWTVIVDDSPPIDSIKLPLGTLTYVINGLTEDQSYLVSVKASTDAGAGDAVMKMFHTTTAGNTFFWAIVFILALIVLLLAIILQLMKK